ncbi:U3 small nucleolar RNA-associated protein 6 homolog [Dendronephthya gigantea]|uniref:U3 small nucleolar RNA-associated protein 6 homolog n=1 Tax=Dendronephthya gigantea TaxID=151771 RepID=UPI001069D505|nr:U3 small nucleolar RNA-associated protein 6 homolog [Dendronephthya gigantea]
MAEYVFQNVEGMLPELEEMERLELFTKDEIKCIVKRRTAFEYKLQKRIVQEADFLRYIQYELNLDLLRKRRKKKCGIQEKILPGEAVFIRKMHFLFQSAVKKFSSDVKLWLQYIEFCKQAGSGQALGRVVGRMLQAHPNNTSLWITAAKYEFEERNNIKSSRILLQRALRLNSNCQNLWLEYFRLELLYIDKVKKRRRLLGINAGNDEDPETPTSSDFISGKTARIVYKNATQNIPDDVEFRLKFVSIYYLFDDCEEGVDEVYQSLSKDFPESEEAWNALACRGLNKLKATKSKISNMPDFEWLKLEEERNKVFEEALKTVKTEKMWNYYIEARYNDLERYSSEIVKKKVNDLLRLFKSADTAKKLCANKCLLWIETLLQNGNSKEATNICKSSLRNFPSSVQLWKQYFNLRSQDSGSLTDGFLDEYCEALGQLDCDEDIITMWFNWFELSLSFSKDGAEKTERVYNRCVAACSANDVTTKIHEDYVELVVLRDGIKSARKLYKRLFKENSVSVSFYRKCLSIEESQAAPSLGRLRKLYESALERFGLEIPDLWLDYIKLELSDGDPNIVSKLHWRAMKSLSGDNVEEFVTKYALLQQSL